MAKAKKCANPLFEQWLKEWQDEAKARDLQMQFCFGKALDSLRRYPLVLETGRDCIILKHFGHKLCDMLDKKLSQHKLLNNLPSSSNNGSKKPRKRERKKTEPDDAPKNDSPSLPEGTCSSQNKSNSNSSKEIINDDSLPAKKRKSINKPYVPKIGSAAFAILITMYKNSQQPNYPGHMFKKDIIFQAQAESDCQMKGTALEHYSGWSSMTTLISKNLVSKKSSPAKYSLTDSGLALAISLYEGHLNVNSDEDNGVDAIEKVQNIDTEKKSSEAVVLLKDENKTKNLPEKPHETYSSSTSKTSDNFDYQVQVSNSPLHFESADRDFSFPDTSVFNHENQYNLVNSDDDDNVFEVETKYGRKNNNVKSNKLIKNDSNEFNYLKNLLINSPIKSSVRKEVPMENVSTVNNDVIVINDDEYDCDSNYAKGQIDNELKYDTEKSRVEHFRSTQKSSTSSEEDFEDFCRENVEPMIKVKNKHEHSIYSKIIDESLSTELHDNEQNNDPIEFAEIDKNIEKISGLRSSNVAESNNKAKPKADEPIQMHTKEIAISNDKNKKTTKKTEIPAEINNELFYLLPNNFDIILLVDTQETSGLKAKAKNDATVSELSKQGVVFEIRSLNVGDFTWIARCRFTKKELVLPYIVERKRIDDLCASIKDSRYHEQKFRLKQSGIKNVIYLIENYGKSYHGCIPMTSLLQAGVNALVQDDFTVKYTRDHKDSMRYLSTMTTILTNIFEGKELISCSKDALSNIERETSEGTEYLIEFSEFNKSSVKTKKFKIREMFIKQLLQLKGLSVDKAVAIAELYPTPKILYNALKESDDKLLADVVAGPNKRKIGPAISKTVYQLYTKYDLS
ncbi:hypothetical protein TKK_0018557 [Trichogramma kaykai]|uniref:Crossover junction endonuclease MUS81 n=1 Tax=Trichogramma kaykai TaxID=54128 RepID=A0ABD2VYH3_9HYME